MNPFNKLKKPDNKGSAIVIVIVTIALVSILASVLLSLSFMNYKMKLTEKRAKDNFYTAETALNQIYVGLEKVVSDALGVAYVKALQIYKTSEDDSAEAARIAAFRTEYMQQVYGELKDPANSEKYQVGETSYDDITELYSIGLASYLDKYMANAMKNGRLVLKCNTASGNPSLATNTSGLVLKDIFIGYTSSDGYYTEICTDICIGYPDIEMKETTILPDILEYACIADQGIQIKDAQNLLVKQSLYAGGNGITVSRSKNVRLGWDNVNVNNAVRINNIVSKGDFVVGDTSTVEIYANNVWAQNVTVNGSNDYTSGDRPNSDTLKMRADVHVQDDLTLNKNNVTVEVYGNYFGFGTKEGASDGSDKSSAIVVNSRNSILDLSDVRTLSLFGHAYLNGNTIVGESYDETDSSQNSATEVMLGTSLATKTDQISFLAPAECLGTITVDGNTTTVVGRNPMTRAEFDKWVNGVETYSDKNYKLLNADIYTNLLGKNLGQYNVPSATALEHANFNSGSFKTLFRTIGNETLCYVYLTFANEEDANRYYRDYQGAANDVIAKYASKYKNEILVNGTGDYQVKGNLFTYHKNPLNSELSVKIIPDTLGAENVGDAGKAEREKFRAMCSKLNIMYNSLTASEKNNDIYWNVIDVKALQELEAGVDHQDVYVTGDAKAVIIDNDNLEYSADTLTEVKEYDPGDAYEVGSLTSNSDVNLVIATGDVVVKGNFTGLIIAGGTVSFVTADSTVSGDSLKVNQLLFSSQVIGGESLIEKYFLNGSKYKMQGNSSTEVQYMDIDSLISYMNWRKY